MSKFGYVLTSRQAGKEAYAAFLPTLSQGGDKEEVLVDFDGVNTLAPSWGDEFLTELTKKFGVRVVIKKTANPSVAVTIGILERQNGYRFKFS